MSIEHIKGEGAHKQRRRSDEGEPLVGLMDKPSVSSKSSPPTAGVGGSTTADLARSFSAFGTAEAPPPPYEWREAPGAGISQAALLVNSPRFVAFVARSGTGKSFLCEYLAEGAIGAKMTVALADFDRDNASLTARFGTDMTLRPLNADDNYYEEGIKKVHEFQKHYHCDVLMDLGFASVRSFCTIAKRLRLQAIQEANGIRPVLVIPLGLREDDLMVLEKLDGAWLPHDVLLVLNAGLVPAGKDVSLSFERVLRDSRIHGLIRRGARSMVMPAMPSGEAFHNTKRPFEWAARMDWANPLSEFEQAGAEEFLREMRAACEKHSDILPFPRRSGVKAKS